MNNVFRLIWSAVRQCWIVASEKVTGKGGIPARTVGSLAAAVLLACGSAAYALPSGNTLVAGQATVESPTAGQMQITQTSNRAIINWQSFGIASGEAVNITQPSAQAALLNRVVGNSSSEIFGKLTANGQVFLVNPNGVLFGRGAEVNVGGLVASSLNITDDNFMNNNLKFFKDGTAGSVSNQGSITAGFAALLGPQVDNSSIIITYKGSTVLGAADAITLNFDPQGLIALKLDQGAYNAQVANSGIIEADGGRVLLTAKSADSILKSMVNNSGVIRARSVDTSNGQILLLGDMDNGTVSVGGTLDASAPNVGNGGFIETSAAHVKVNDNTRVTTLAANGQNGTWLIDPDGFTIAASGGDMTGAAVATALAGGNFSIVSTSGSGADGNINVNDAISWSANKLTLTATNDINVNAVMTASGTSSLDLEPGSGKVNMGLNSSGFYGRVDFPGRSGTGFLTIGGLGYTVLSDQVGTPGSITSTDLQGMSISVAALTHHYALGSNIDASSTSSWPSGAGFQPVGNSSNNFTGSFNGLGHTISGLFINRPTTDNVGMFGYTSNTATIRNVGLLSVNITGRNSTGSLVGNNYASISNSYAVGTVSGAGDVGGLIGDSRGSINNSYANVAVIAGSGVGGGLVGMTTDTVSISNSYAAGSVTGGNWLGGLVGMSGGSISNSYATGNVGGASEIGGLVGENQGSVSSSYATGSVTGTDKIGGLVGYNMGSSSISSSYAVGTVSGSSAVGGLVGEVTGASSFNSSYWNTATTGQTGACGINYGTGSALGLNTAQMKQQANFSGWDFTNIWRIYEGNSYPLLKSLLIPLTITAANATKTYDGLAYSGGNGVTYSVAGAGASPNLLGAVTYSGTSQAAINADSYVITPGGFYSNQQGYDISYANGALTVDKANLTLSGSRIYDGTTTVAGSVLTAAGANGETFSIGGTGDTSNLASKNIQTNSTLASVIGLSLGTSSNGGVASNYNAISTAGSLVTVTPATLTIGAVTNSKTYDGGTSAVATPTVTSGSLKGADIFTTLTETYASKNVLGTNGSTLNVNYVINDGNNGDNYTVTTNSANGSITPANLTLSGSRIYDGTTTVAGSVLTAAGANGETFSIGGTGDTSNLASKNVQTNSALVSIIGLSLGASSNGGVASNYNAISTAGSSVIITPANLTLSTINVTKTYDGVLTAAGTATVTSGTLFGTDSISGGSFAFTDKNVGSGTKTVTVSGVTVTDGNSGNNYTVSFAGNSTCTITKAPLTITANNDSKTYSGTAYTGGNGVSYNSFVNDETAAVLGGSLTYSGTSQGVTAAGSYVITPGGLTSGNYTLNFVDGTLTINQAAAPSTTLPTTGGASGPGNLRDQLALLQTSLNNGNSPTQTDLLRFQMLESKRGEIHNMLGSVSKDLIVIINGGIRR